MDKYQIEHCIQCVHLFKPVQIFENKEDTSVFMSFNHSMIETILNLMEIFKWRFGRTIIYRVV